MFKKKRKQNLLLSRDVCLVLFFSDSYNMAVEPSSAQLYTVSYGFQTVCIPLLMGGLNSQLWLLLQKISHPLLIRAIASCIDFTVSVLVS
jgi:hypothetical protein